MRKAIRQMISTRVSGLVAIVEYAKYCIWKKTLTIVFSQGCGVMKDNGFDFFFFEVILVIPCWPYSEFLSSASSKTRVISKY